MFKYTTTDRVNNTCEDKSKAEKWYKYFRLRSVANYNINMNELYVTLIPKTLYCAAMKGFMKYRNSLGLSVLFTLFTFSMVFYQACKKKKQSATDPCAAVTCHHSGTCSGGMCSCRTGYEGTYCDSLVKNKFTGEWTGDLSCIVAGNKSNTLLISPGNDDITLLVENAGGYGYTVTAKVSYSNQIAIPLQQIAPDTSIAGTITFLSGSEIKFEYTLEGTQHEACHGNYTRQ
jgi:hypothetical protein